MAAKGYLSDVRAVILEQGLGKGRARILCKQLKTKGGSVISSLVSETAATHLLIGNNVRPSRLPVLLGMKEVPRGVRVVRADWLSSCLARGEYVREEEYEVPLETTPSTTPITSPHHKLEDKGDGEKKKCVIKEDTTTEGETTEEEEVVGKNKQNDIAERFPTSSRRWATTNKIPVKTSHTDDSDSDYIDSGEEEGEREGELADVNISAVPPLAKRKRRWMCEIPTTEAKSWINLNKHITDKLEELLRVYQNSADDKWRAFSTTKVIQAIKKHPTEITTYEEALNVPFVGKRLALKIEEIIASGGLRRLEAIDKTKQSIITAFTNIHGVGLVIAEQFYAQGYRSVEELATSGVLNRQQRIGVKHYDDFQERMKRDEVTLIEQRMRELAHLINSGLEVITCGSYRRGKPTCGDVDILITHSDGRSHRGVLPHLIKKGRESGFLTDDLSIHNDQKNGGGKYLGVCKLSGPDRKYRRIDIYVTPYSEFPCMLVHFTGSSHLNRSMRSKADKLGMSLSEHSLNIGVIRKNGVKVFDGTPVPVFTERDIFNYLDIPYKEPTDRDLD